MNDTEIHRRNNTYKLIVCIGRFQGRVITETLYRGLTYEQAEAIKKQDRRLTAVQEPKKAK